MKNFAKTLAEFFSVNAGGACIWYCGFNTVSIAQRILELLPYIMKNKKGQTTTNSV
jgi:hypothetical protein